MKNASKVLTLLMLALPLTCGAVSSNPVDNAPTNAVAAGRQACWRQAGLSRGVLQQRKEIVSDARQRIRSVEGDSTLNARQQRQEIHGIRLDARQQVAKVVSPEQRQTLRQCRLDRALSHSAPQGDEKAPSGSSSEPASQPN